MAIIVKYKKRVNEDDSPSSSQQSESPNAARISEINSKIVQEQNKILQAEKTYQNIKATCNNNIIQLNNEKAKLGASVDANSVKTESLRSDFKMGLFESTVNKTDELFGIICLSFDSIDGLSYRPSDTRCRTIARDIINNIYRKENKESMSEDVFKDYVYSRLNNSHVSLSKKERDAFMENLLNGLKESVLFSWIFENNKTNE